MSSPAHDSSEDERLGTTVGGYRIESILGVGGMGRVYRAVGDDGVAVALKLVKADLAKDPTFLRRFDREVRIARTIVHPHVIPVLDAGEHEGAPYLVQRLIERGTLEERLQASGPLDLTTAVRMCSQVASGLDALNEAGMIHRDVKPANILLDEEGNAYITDFGLSKDTRGTVLTRPGQALGSLDYMAPEQIRAEDVSAATDVYALGCVLCECLSGAPPFADRTGMHVLWAHLQDDPPDPCAGRADLPPEVRTVILSALEKNPTRRPQSPGEFARALEQVARPRSGTDHGAGGVHVRPVLPD
jgi:serine/threonine-protein kinase